MRLQYPTNIRVIQLPCTGRVDILHLLRAFEDGLDGVYVAGCMEGDCHFLTGNLKARRRIALLKKLLSTFGIDEERLWLRWIAASEGHMFAETIEEMTEHLKELGPSPLKSRKIA